MESQLGAIETLLQVLDSKSYRITNQTRIDMFKSFEKPTLSLARRKLSTLRKDCTAQQEVIKTASQVLRHNLEILEEGQSRAILMFTIVTIIFLPLSFVATIFGMNTTDIRNMDKTQTLFWEVALPFTVVIAVFTLTIAYKGSEIRAMLSEVGHKAMRYRIEVRFLKPYKGLPWFKSSGSVTSFNQEKGPDAMTIAVRRRPNVQIRDPRNGRVMFNSLIPINNRARDTKRVSIRHIPIPPSSLDSGSEVVIERRRRRRWDESDSDTDV
jgi:hypothetical protein